MYKFYSFFVSEAFIAGFFTILGTLLGVFLTSRFSRNRENARMLIDFYADFVHAYTKCAPAINDMDDLRLMTVSIEKLSLICPDEAKKPLSFLYYAVMNNKWSAEPCRMAYEELQQIMKKIAKKYKVKY